MLTRFALLAIRAPRRVLLIAGFLLIGGGLFGAPVAGHLLTGGFTDPAADSTKATQVIDDRFAGGPANLVFVVSAPGGVDGATARANGTRIEQSLHQRSDWLSFAASYWTSPQGSAGALRSKDGNAG